MLDDLQAAILLEFAPIDAEFAATQTDPPPPLHWEKSGMPSLNRSSLAFRAMTGRPNPDCNAVLTDCSFRSRLNA
jgi:hypothetical protein